jgi:hypothetical protein
MTVRSPIRTGVLLLALAALAGCTAVYDVRYDYDPTADLARLKTYAHVPPPQGDPGKDHVRVSPLTDARVKLALDRALPARGLTLDAAGAPDLLVGYFIAVNQRVDWAWVSGYWGWGWWGPPQAVPYTYDEGTLVVDLVDATTRKLVWRGSCASVLDPSADPERNQARIDAAVERILSNWPPPQKR